MPLSKSRQKRLIWVYHRLIRYSKKTLKQYLDDDTAVQLMADTKEAVPGVVSRLPETGGAKNLHSPVIQLTGVIVCFYIAAKKAGLSPEEAVYMIREVCEMLINRIPKPVGRLIGKLAFSKAGINMFKRQAAMSQKRQYPEDFVFEAEISRDADGGVTIANIFSECAVHQLFEREHVPELKPYCNFFDPLFSARFNMGVDSNHTFAQYGDACRLEFNSNRPTKTPDNIAEMMVRGREILKRRKA